MKRTGRPSKRTPEVVNEIVERLSKGEPLAVICRDAGMPNDDTVRNWADNDPELSRSIARARLDGFDAIAQEAMEIADNSERDWGAVKDENGEVIGIKVDGEHVQRSKLRVETRLKLLAKWDPKRYGDKVQAEVTGAEGGPMQAQIAVSFINKVNG